jgi:[ribosomal protein S5]-alanine N-acetyltransferase
MIEKFIYPSLVTERMHLMVKFGFNEMKLNLIEATVEPGNSKSIKLIQKLGFEQAKAKREFTLFYVKK